MKNPDDFVKGIIASYTEKISEEKKDLDYWERVGIRIKDNYSGCPTKYSLDTVYQNSVKCFEACKARISVYTLAKIDLEAILSCNKMFSLIDK